MSQGRGLSEPDLSCTWPEVSFMRGTVARTSFLTTRGIISSAKDLVLRPVHLPQAGLAGRCQNATMQQLFKRIWEEP